MSSAPEQPIVLPRVMRGWFARRLDRVSVAFDRLPIRTRLAAVSALLTFTILCAFALVVGSLSVHRIRANFNREVAVAGDNVAELLGPKVTGNYIEGFKLEILNPSELNRVSEDGDAVVRIMTESGTLLDATNRAPNLGLSSEADVFGYRVHTRIVALNGPVGGAVVVQYGRRLSDLEATIARVELLLVLGVLAGTMLALLAGIAIARRAMAPIALLTSTAEQIARTRDPSRRLPEPTADDEVAELSRTLAGMLRELDAAHAETEATLARQRQFVADASHELRTPLTSVLANLELLSESLRGEDAEAARSALRSSQRMRRLVADLLLLARSDVGRVVAREPCDLAQVVVEAAAELGPVSDRHEISLDTHPVIVRASRDELHRLTLNLIENALRHTPPGTEIRVSTGVEASGPTQQAAGEAYLVVEDDGPGVPEHLVGSLFERFVRGAGDRGGSFGLGLAIVRTVAESHGGSVSVEQTHPGAEHPGARFVVRLPAESRSAGPSAEGATTDASAGNRQLV
ncbi:MAG TPA: HAMP domain-containing sensor histidine kinase [Solirubrobacteraceae bacterium]|jgi:signal transduction histidine kinase|nr:HAMP domain-containing sensor histidine kinase [Solirubrobacteraceae bacterium]